MSASSEVSLGVLVRTLLAAGYRIQDAVRQPLHAELIALSYDELGVDIPYVFAVTDEDTFTQDQLNELRAVATDQRQHLVLIAASQSEGIFSLDGLLARLGGAIPTWRALSSDYVPRLQRLSENQLPSGLTGEAWQLFEEAAADGLEFLFGLRVNRLGSKNRGARVPDGVCRTPDGAILLVDAKAARYGFDATNENLRALKEYATQQVAVQRGQSALSACLIVSSTFQQPPDRLAAIGSEFLADTGVPLGFLCSATLGRMIDLIRPSVRFRNSIRWRRIFCVPGLIDTSVLEREIQLISRIQMPGG